MFKLEKFIADSVTFRPSSMFKGDIELAEMGAQQSCARVEDYKRKEKK